MSTTTFITFASKVLMGCGVIAGVLGCMGCTDGSDSHTSGSSQFEREVTSLVTSLQSDYGAISATTTTATFSADDVEVAISRIAGKAGSDTARPPGYEYWSSGKVTVSIASGKVAVEKTDGTSVYKGTISNYSSCIQGTLCFSQYLVSQDMTTTSSFQLTGETHATFDGDHQFTLVANGSGSHFSGLPVTVIADGSSLSTTQGYLDELVKAAETNGTMPTDMIPALYVITENIIPSLSGYHIGGSLYGKEVYTGCETDIGTISGTRAFVNRFVSADDVLSFSVAGDSSKYLWIDDGDACKLYRDGMLVADD